MEKKLEKKLEKSWKKVGKKLKFVDIEQSGHSVQLKLSRSNFASDDEFLEGTTMLSLGDRIGR